MKALIFTLFSLFIFQANAQIVTGAVSAATGRSGRAAVEPGDTTFINPAGLVHLRGRDLYTFYAPGDLAIALTENSKDIVVPMSLAYFRHEISDRSSYQDVRIAAAEFILKKWSVGLAPHYFQFMKDSINTYSQGEVDLGLTFTPTSNTGIAFVGYDLLEDSKDIPENYKPQARSAVGFNYIYQDFLRARFDIQSQKGHRWNTPNIGGGIETYTSAWIIARIGYLSDEDLKQDIASLGLGFNAPKFRFNYSMAVTAPEMRDPRHYVDLSIPF